MTLELQSAEVKDLFSAVCKMQSQLTGAIKDGRNPHFNSDFATLESCIEASREHLSANGLSVIQSMTILESKPCLVTTLAHSSGQYIRSITPIFNPKNTAQDMGSGITYARRYAYAAIIGLHQTDDDGNGATDGTKKSAAKLPPPPKELKNFAPKAAAPKQNGDKPFCNTCGEQMLPSKQKAGEFYCLPCWKGKKNGKAKDAAEDVWP